MVFDTGYGGVEPPMKSIHPTATAICRTAFNAFRKNDMASNADDTAIFLDSARIVLQTACSDMQSNGSKPHLEQARDLPSLLMHL